MFLSHRISRISRHLSTLRSCQGTILKDKKRSSSIPTIEISSKTTTNLWRSYARPPSRPRPRNTFDISGGMRPTAFFHSSCSACRQKKWDRSMKFLVINSPQQHQSMNGWLGWMDGLVGSELASLARTDGRLEKKPVVQCM